MAGAIVGLGCALITSRVLASQLYGVKAADPETLLVATFLLLAAAALACYLPGRQAANVDPMVTLRDT